MFYLAVSSNSLHGPFAFGNICVMQHTGVGSALPNKTGTVALHGWALGTEPPQRVSGHQRSSWSGTVELEATTRKRAPTVLGMEAPVILPDIK